MKYRNPVISGFHPDPSVVRMGSDFGLVTSASAIAAPGSRAASPAVFRDVCQNGTAMGVEWAEKSA